MGIMRPEPQETLVDKARRAGFWLLVIAALAIVFVGVTSTMGRSGY